MKIEKKVVLEHGTARLTGSVDEVIQALVEAKLLYNQYELSLVSDGGYDDRWINLVGVRLETAAEFKERCDREIQKAEKALERKRLKFEKLKKELYDTTRKEASNQA